LRLVVFRREEPTDPRNLNARLRLGGMLGLALLVAVAVCCPPGPESLQKLEARMADLINVEREARGLAPLAFSAALSRVGREYSTKMAVARAVNHALANPVEKRIRAALPNTCTFGENISKHTSIDYSRGDLLLSSCHRANLLSEQSGSQSSRLGPAERSAPSH
jgi:uncharacterized protein YkwD